MSDRLSKNDIEDVLSSIRRLVTEETQSAVQPRGVRPPSVPRGPADRLVLTPDFRIGIAETDAETEEESVVARDEAEADDAADDFAEGTGAGSLSGRLAVLEAAVSDHGDDWEQVGAVAASEDDPPAVFRHIADVESELGHAAEADKGVDSAADAPAAAHWEDEPPKAASPVEPSEDAEDVLFEGSDEEALDEEALRDLIREMIREELQGELGARITRNVRKLVRAEVNRALASRDLG